MKLSKTVVVRLLVCLAILIAAGVPTYLWQRAVHNAKQQVLDTSFLATFGGLGTNLTILSREELRVVPVVKFQIKGNDGRDYIVLAGEFGSDWGILKTWDITPPAITPAPSPTP